MISWHFRVILSQTRFAGSAASITYRDLLRNSNATVCNNAHIHYSR